MQNVAQQMQLNPIFTGLAIAAGLVVIVLTGGLAIIIIFKAANGSIDLSRLLSEPNGDASMSRLQLLIFTFVIALSLFLIILGKTPPSFPESLPADLMTLLGISASSYLVSKGIQFSNPAGVARPGISVSPATQSFTLTPGATPSVAPLTVTFTAVVSSGGSTAPLPTITWALDSPSRGTLTPSGNSVTYAADPATPLGTKITLRAQVSGYEDGIAQISY